MIKHRSKLVFIILYRYTLYPSMTNMNGESCDEMKCGHGVSHHLFRDIVTRRPTG